MKIFLQLTISIACLLKTSSGVDIYQLKDIFDQADIDVWAAMKYDEDGKPITTNLGRSGNIKIDVDDKFFDQQCSETIKFAGKNGDVCFIVQTSCRNNKKDFQDVMKSITRDMADILKALDNQTMYSTVTYSGNAKVVAKWSGNLGKINTGKLKGGKLCEDCRARTDRALAQCRKQFEDDAVADREMVPKTIVLFTDGVSVDSKFQIINITRNLTTESLLDIRSRTNISMQVIRIKNEPGATVDGEDEWSVMSHKADKEFPESIHVDKLGESNDQHVDIPIVGTKDDNEIAKECCTADVVFVLDTSDSIKKADVALLLDFIHGFIEVQQKIIDPTNPDKHSGLQISVLTYCGTVKIVANLGEKGREELMSTIDAINRDTVNCHFTSTHLALSEAYAQLTGPNQRIEPHVRKIVVLATDGRTWKVGHNNVYQGPDTIDAAQKIKDDLKGEIFVAGLPNYKTRPDVGEWEAIASEPKTCTFIDMRNGTFEHLNAVGKYLTKKICMQSTPEFCYFDYLNNAIED